MSETIKCVVGLKAQDDVLVTSYSGGKGVGQCLQLNQGIMKGTTIKMDKAQVVELHEAFGEWLNKDRPDNHIEVLCNLINAVTDARNMADISDTNTTPISQRLKEAHTAACDWWVRMKG